MARRAESIVSCALRAHLVVQCPREIQCRNQRTDSVISLFVQVSHLGVRVQAELDEVLSWCLLGKCLSLFRTFCLLFSGIFGFCFFPLVVGLTAECSSTHQCASGWMKVIPQITFYHSWSWKKLSSTSKSCEYSRTMLIAAFAPNSIVIEMETGSISQT